MRWEGAIECWGGVTGLRGHAATAMTGKRRETALLQTLVLQSQHVLGGGSRPCCCYANCNTSFNLMILMLLPAIQRSDHVRINRLETKWVCWRRWGTNKVPATSLFTTLHWMSSTWRKGGKLHCHGPEPNGDAVSHGFHGASDLPKSCPAGGSPRSVVRDVAPSGRSAARPYRSRKPSTW